MQDTIYNLLCLYGVDNIASSNVRFDRFKMLATVEGSPIVLAVHYGLVAVAPDRRGVVWEVVHGAEGVRIVFVAELQGVIGEALKVG